MRQHGRFRDPALWVWLVVALLALLPLKVAFAQAFAEPAMLQADPSIPAIGSADRATHAAAINRR